MEQLTIVKKSLTISVRMMYKSGMCAVIEQHSIYLTKYHQIYNELPYKHDLLIFHISSLKYIIKLLRTHIAQIKLS